MDAIPGASTTVSKTPRPAKDLPAIVGEGGPSPPAPAAASEEAADAEESPANEETAAITSTAEEQSTEEQSTEEESSPASTEAADVGEETDRHTYTPRGQPMSDADRQAMITKHGSWTLVDDKERPSKDLYKKYPTRDIPRSEFPSNAWQIDKEYLAKFLPEGIALAQRAQEGILAEYGHTEGPFLNRSEMFHMDMYEGTLEGVQFPKDFQGDKGGWTTKKSWEGLKRRILHAVMTEDWFVFAMGGHSAAAGHG
jgi:hypothetical protein